MDEGKDYNVHTDIKVRLDFDGTDEMNILAMPAVQSQFTDHVMTVFRDDRTLSEHVSGNLDFTFDGRNARVQYIFSCHDDSPAEAESFSRFCVNGVKPRLQAFGCVVQAVTCHAEEADMTWLDELEDRLFGKAKKGA